MRIWILFIVSLLFFSCKNNSKNETGSIAKYDTVALETQYENSPNDSLLTELVYAYGSEISNSKNKEDKIKNLKKAIKLTKKQDYDAYRTVFLMELIKTDPQGTADELLQLASIYEDEDNTEMQSIIYLGFKHRFPKDTRRKDINHKIFLKLDDHKLYFKNLLKDAFDNSENGGVNVEKGRNYIDQVIAFSLGFAGDPAIPNYLMISADVARAIGDPNTSVGQYDWVYNYYPEYPKAPLALFLKGYEIDSALKKYDDAKKVYETFLRVYPNDTLSKDVKYLIQNLGKSTEDAFKEMLPVEQ